MSERQTVLLRATKLGSRWLLEAHHLQTHAEHRFKSLAALETWLRQTLPEEDEKNLLNLPARDGEAKENI